MPVYLYDRGLWEIANVITIFIFLYSYSLYDLTDRGKIYFLYTGKLILVAGLIMSSIMVVSGIRAGVFDPQSGIYYPFRASMIMISFIIGTIVVTKLWNYLFLGNGKLQLRKDDLGIGETK
jgi:hypothetical protein